MADNGSLQNRMKRSGSGCAVYGVTFAGVSTRWTT